MFAVGKPYGHNVWTWVDALGHCELDQGFDRCCKRSAAHHMTMRSESTERIRRIQLPSLLPVFSIAIRISTVTKSSMPFPLLPVVTARMLSSYGGEDLLALEKRVAAALPESKIEAVPATEDDSASFTWSHPAPDHYGPKCSALWKSFCTIVDQTFSRDAAQNFQHGVRYRLDLNGRPWGRIEHQPEADGGRDLINGIALHCGDRIKLLLPDGTWLSGSYEIQQGDANLQGRQPLFCFHGWGGPLCCAIDETSILKSAKIPMSAKSTATAHRLRLRPLRASACAGPLGPTLPLHCLSPRGNRLSLYPA